MKATLYFVCSVAGTPVRIPQGVPGEIWALHRWIFFLKNPQFCFWGFLTYAVNYMNVHLLSVYKKLKQMKHWRILPLEAFKILEIGDHALMFLELSKTADILGRYWIWDIISDFFLCSVLLNNWSGWGLVLSGDKMSPLSSPGEIQSP